MLLSSNNDESDGNKTFEVYSSYITVASNIFEQTKTLIERGSVLWFISLKSVTFLDEGTFSLTLSVQKVLLDFSLTVKAAT